MVRLGAGYWHSGETVTLVVAIGTLSWRKANAAGLANDQVSGERDRARGPPSGTSNPLKEELGGDPGHSFCRLVDHRQERRDDREVRHVVKADERNVVRDLKIACRRACITPTAVMLLTAKTADGRSAIPRTCCAARKPPSWSVLV